MVHHEQLCWLIVEKRLFFGTPFAKIAKQRHFRGGKRTAWRIWQRFLRTGDPSPHQGLRLAPPANKKLTAAQHDALLQMIVDADPDQMLHEIAASFLREHFVSLSVADMSREMRRANYTHKKLSYLAYECDRFKADVWQAHLMLTYRMDQLVWIDEFGKRKKPPQRVFGWSLRGKRAQSNKQLLTSDGSYTVLAAFDLEMGHCTHYTHDNSTGGYNADAFYAGFTLKVMNHCNPYPGPRSVIVLDNWIGHKAERFIDACRQSGLIIEYGVPYAPHKMVHEPLGGHAKQVLKKNAIRWGRVEGHSSEQQIGPSLC